MTKPIARDPIYRKRAFDADIIELCVRWYITYRLSYRDLVEMMAERGVQIAHSTIWAHEKASLSSKDPAMHQSLTGVEYGKIQAVRTLSDLANNVDLVVTIGNDQRRNDEAVQHFLFDGCRRRRIGGYRDCRHQRARTTNSKESRCCHAWRGVRQPQVSSLRGGRSQGGQRGPCALVRGSSRCRVQGAFCAGSGCGGVCGIRFPESGRRDVRRELREHEDVHRVRRRRGKSGRQEGREDVQTDRGR